MPKPSSVLNLKPRRTQPVPEDIAKRLEQAAEQKGNGVAGERDRMALVSFPVEEPVATTPLEARAPAPAQALEAATAAETHAREAASPQRPEVANPQVNEATAPQAREATAPQAREATAPRASEATAPELDGPAVALPSASAGTMHSPRVRKDGIRTRSTSLHLPIDLGRQLAMHCALTGRKQNDVIVRAIRAYLGENKATT